MEDQGFNEPGPYTLAHLGQTFLTHAPAVILGGAQLLDGLRGDGRLAGSTRIAIQLRLAKLLGCPLCRALFPALAQRAGMGEAEVQAALRGEGAQLAPETAAALAWVDEIVRAGGQPQSCEAAAGLTAAQRDHLVVLTRLDVIIHSVGLMFLPRSMIERAFAD